MSRTLSQFFALLAIALFSIPTILAACNCAPGFGCVTGLFGVTSCSLTPCALGFYSGGGAAACTLCPAGSRLVGGALTLGATGCTPCAAGSFAALPGSATCALASPGSYVPSAGATAETLCAPGSYQNLIGQTSCPLCPCGSYNPLFGQIICLPCGEFDVCLIALLYALLTVRTASHRPFHRSPHRHQPHRLFSPRVHFIHPMQLVCRRFIHLV